MSQQLPPPDRQWSDGSVRLFSSGSVAGDHYLDRNNGDVYQWDGGSWSLVANIRGPGFVFRGAWDNSTAYSMNDVVTQDNGGGTKTYITVDGVTGGDPPGAGGASWVLLLG